MLCIIVLALGLDFWSIPSGSWFGPSVIKQAVIRARYSVLGGARPTGPSWRFPAHFVQRSSEIRVIWFYTNAVPGQLTEADFSTLLSQGWQYPGRLFYRLNEGDGLYHITSSTTHFSFPSQATPAEEQRMARALIAGFEALPRGHELRRWEALREAHRMLKNGVRSETTHLPIGYLRNSIALALLALLIILPIRGRIDLHLRVWKARLLKRYPPGHCPHCGYDARGLTRCPECGANLATT